MINWILRFGAVLSVIHAANNFFLPLVLIDKKAYFRSLLLFAEPSEPLLELYDKLDNPENTVHMQEIPNETRRQIFELASWTGNTDIMKLLISFGDADYDLLSSIQIIADRLSLDSYIQEHWSSALQFLVSQTPNPWLEDLENILVYYIGKKCHGAPEILQIMRDDPRFPVQNTKMAMSLAWYNALIGLIHNDNYPLLRTIISDWTLFKTRFRLSTIPASRREFLVEALILKRVDMVFLLATRYWIFPSLRVLSQGQHRRALLKIIPTLKGFDWTGIENNKEGVLVKFLKHLHQDYPYHVDVQAALLGSMSLAIDKDEYIANAIRHGILSHVLGVMKAGFLNYGHLTTLHETGKFTSIYELIDQHFGSVNLNVLQFRGEGRALVYLIENIRKSTLRSRITLESLLPGISNCGPMKVLSLLEDARCSFNRETELRSDLDQDQWILFQTYPWEVDDGDLAYSAYKRLAELGSGDMLNMHQMRPSVLFAVLNHASTDKDYPLATKVCSIISNRFSSS